MIKNKYNLARIGLVFTTLAWGGTFVMVSEALKTSPPFAFGAYRFLVAFLATLIFVRGDIINLKSIEVDAAVKCGFLLFAGYAFQNFGLWENVNYTKTTPSKSAFITSISVIMVPFILTILGIEKVKNKLWCAILLAIIGLYLLIDPVYEGVSIGDLLTFFCAICFALHIIIQDKYVKKNISISRFFLIQVLVVSLFSFICSLFFDTSSIIWNEQLINAIIVTGIICTAIAIMIMVWAQQILSPSQTAIIFSLEPVFAALFSWIIISEVLGIQGWVGGLIVVVGVILAGQIESTD